MRGKLLLLLLVAAAMGLRPAETYAATSELKAGGWTGLATSYYPNVMERVIRVRRAQGYKVRSDVFGYVAVPNCNLIGKVITVCVKGRCVRVQVMDCSQDRDWSTHTANGTRAWVEFGYKEAKKLGMAGVGRFRVTVFGLYYILK